MGTYRCKILSVLMHEKDANVRQVELKPIIREVAKEMGGHMGEGMGSVLECGLHREKLKKRRGSQKLK